jgi:DNA polymerase I-like protein with 3'-5' exonuclease and polymerase domains
MISVIREVDAACTALEQYHGPLGVDLETTGVRPYHDQICVLSLCLYASGEPVVIVLHLRDGVIPPEVAWQLERPELVLVWHNGSMFDSILLFRAGVDIWRTRHVDTYINARVLLGGQEVDGGGRAVSAGYAAEVERRLDIRLPADKKRRQRQKWGDRLWLDEQDVAYCVRDVLYLGPLAVAQWACATPGQRHALRLEQELADVMTRISINGLPVDRSHLVAAKARYQAQMQEARERLRAILGNVNPNAFAQVRAAINARYGTSLTSVDKDSRLEAMLAGVPWAEAAEPYHAYQAAQALERLCKPEQIADDGWIHGLYDQLGARSGRMSARKPNTQQIPRAIRRAFVAPAGYVVISIDFSQLEICLGADVADDAAMRAAVESGDVYRAMAASIFGCAVEEVTDDQRATMKIFMLGSQYGGGANVLRKSMRKNGRSLSWTEAEDLLAAFHQAFADLNAMRERAHCVAESAAQKRQCLAIELGTGMQRCYWPNELAGNSLLATRVSGLAAVGLKVGLLLAKDAGLDRYLTNAVHDELVLVCPQEEAQQCTASLMQCMVEGMRRVAPGARIVAESHSGPSWDKTGDTPVAEDDGLGVDASPDEVLA